MSDDLFAGDSLPEDEVGALRDGCARSLRVNGPHTAADALAELATLTADDLVSDKYGEGGAVAVLELRPAEVVDAVRALLPA